MKTNNNSFEKHNYTRNADELLAAQSYVFQTSIAVIGRSNFDAQLFKRLKMPALPLLVGNREQRAALHKPWFGARCPAFVTCKCKNAINTFKDAIQQEKQKQMNLFNWKKLLQDPQPGDFVDRAPMTNAQFKQWCQM
jgi:hypothetical protein